MINKKIINFELDSLVEDSFKKVSNKDLNGKWSVLFFYPADFTFVCPTELEDLADYYEEFKKINVEVFAISTDSHFAHKAWHDTSPVIKKIKFPMVSDKLGELSKSFDFYNSESGLSFRGTVVLNPEGLVKIVEMTDDGIGRNANELLRKIQAAQFVAENNGEVCPAKWKPGSKTLKPGLDLVGKI